MDHEEFHVGKFEQRVLERLERVGAVGLEPHHYEALLVAVDRDGQWARFGDRPQDAAMVLCRRWIATRDDRLGVVGAVHLRRLEAADRADGPWYRVVGRGLSSAPKRTAEAAWESFYRRGARAYGYRRADAAAAREAHAARLVEAATRTEALRAGELAP